MELIIFADVGGGVSVHPDREWAKPSRSCEWAVDGLQCRLTQVIALDLGFRVYIILLKTKCK